MGAASERLKEKTGTTERESGRRGGKGGETGGKSEWKRATAESETGAGDREEKNG